MFRRIAKLRRARRALREGRVEDALSLADDPEIREHLKAERLRRACMRVLQERAERRVERGELSGAIAELEDLVERGHDPAAKERAQEIRGMQDERREAEDRARTRYFRARLELDRGDLDRAEELLEESLGDHETENARRALDEIRERRALARREIERARELLATRPGRAEEALVRAHEAHPRAEELKLASLELARVRIGILGSSSASDGAIASFLVEHGLMKRRLLGEMTSVEQRDLDADLNRLVRSRVDEHLAEGRIRAAARLLERRRENLAPDAELDATEESVKALVGVEGLLDRGEFDLVDGLLVAAARRLGKLPAIGAARQELERRRKQVDPALARAEAALLEGKLEEGKEALLDVLAHAGEHVAARRRLRAVNEANRERLSRLLEARRLIDRGKLDDAMELLLALEDEGARGRDIALMRREVEFLELSATRRGRASSSPATPRTARHVADREPSGHEARRWMLGVEEFGEFLVLEDDDILIGSQGSTEADVRILAPLASRHARLIRKTSFHGGCRYSIEACEGADLAVNGTTLPRADLEDGDRIRLGREFEMTFRRPCPRSGAVRLDLAGSWTVSGCPSFFVLPPSGRAGSLLVADRPDAHVRTDAKLGDIEIYREPGGDLVARGSRGVSVDRAEARAEVRLGATASLQSEDLVLVIGPG